MKRLIRICLFVMLVWSAVIFEPKPSNAEKTSIDASVVFRKALALPDLSKVFSDEKNFVKVTEDLQREHGASAVCHEGKCTLVIE